MNSSSKYIVHFIYENGIRNLFPGYFAFVMATGIVSLAAFLQKMTAIAKTLLYLNIAAYIILWVLLLLRIFLCRDKLKADLADHAKAPGFFTIIAGTSVLGRQFFTILNHNQLTFLLFLLASGLLILVTYTFFTTITIKQDTVPLDEGINGTWLLSIVATQSVSILGMDMVVTLQNAAIREVLQFAMLVLFFIGCMLYVFVITLIFYRFSFFKLLPESLTGPYWINMGAVAITTLAGTTLLMADYPMPLFVELQIFIKGLTLFFWSIGTWWIPLLLILGYWRHFANQIPLPWTQAGYEPSYWSIVFPLGMYTTCTWNLAGVLETPFLLAIPKIFIYLAFVGWIGTFSGLFHLLFKNLILRTSS